jgi:HPt (histidine-containing phosphotransfer) domain-containing protein
MMDELYAKFLPQFVELARDRMQRAREIAGRRDAASLTAVMRELHAIAGEAGLLGLSSIVPAARRAEEQAKRLLDGDAAADGGAFTTALDELSLAIDACGSSIAEAGPS